MIIFFIYRFFLIPLLKILVFFLRPFSKGKLQATLNLHKNHPFVGARDPQRKVLWIHAASGEVEYARSIIRSLQPRRSEIFILLTFSSPSAIKLIQPFQSELDAWGPAPWDTRTDVQYFLKKWKPSMVLFSRTDVWPELSYQLFCNKTPSLLFSATLANESSRTRGLARSLTKWALNHLTTIFCVTENDLENFQNLDLTTPLSVQGDTRYDQVFYRLSHPKNFKTELGPKDNDSCIVLGSTWPEDENIFIPLISKFPELRWVIVPHEVGPGHISWIEKKLRQHHVEFQFYSSAINFSAQVLIIDQVGLLAEIYQWADLAFVGGSFRKQVHSVMEPLAIGLPILVGPYHQNNREALMFKEKSIESIPLVNVVNDTNQFETELTKILQSDLNRFNKKATEMIKAQCGASDTVLHWISENIHFRPE